MPLVIRHGSFPSIRVRKGIHAKINEDSTRGESSLTGRRSRSKTAAWSSLDNQALNSFSPTEMNNSKNLYAILPNDQFLLFCAFYPSVRAGTDPCLNRLEMGAFSKQVVRISRHHVTDEGMRKASNPFLQDCVES